MIVTGIINLSYYLINSVINVFPLSAGFAQGSIDAIKTVAGYLFILDPLVPISTLATAVGIAFSLEIGVFTFKSIKWIISHIPWVGGKG